jgi:hypothetical protein
MGRAQSILSTGGIDGIFDFYLEALAGRFGHQFPKLCEECEPLRQAVWGARKQLWWGDGRIPFLLIPHLPGLSLREFASTILIGGRRLTCLLDETHLNRGVVPAQHYVLMGLCCGGDEGTWCSDYRARLAQYERRSLTIFECLMLLTYVPLVGSSGRRIVLAGSELVAAQRLPVLNTNHGAPGIHGYWTAEELAQSRDGELAPQLFSCSQHIVV